MKTRFLFFFVVVVSLLVVPVHAAPLGEGTGGGGEATPMPSAATTTDVQAAGEAHLYPTASAPKVGRVEPGDTVRVVEQLDRWYRIEVVERALGAPVVPLADGWVAEDVFGQPLDGVPPATRPTAIPTATATATPSSSPSAAPTATPTDVPFGVAPTPPSTAGSNVGTATGSASGTTATMGIPRSAGTINGTQSVSRQPVPIARSIIVQQCIEANDNDACDVNEGIGGVTAYVLDARTGEVLGQSISNERGITHVYITALSDADLVVNVPYLSENQPFGVTNGEIDPIKVDDEVALPGLLP